MKTYRLACFVGLIVAACSPTSDYTKTDGGPNNPAAKGQVYAYNFDAAPTGALPSELAHVLGDWRVSEGAQGRFLEQTGEFHTADFPRVVLKDIAFTNVHAKVRCSMRAGETDRACGLMWRFVDSDNYYLTRANSLEDNVRFYKVVDGDREELASRDIKIPAGDWHTLEAFMEGTHVRVVWDGQTVIEDDDRTFQVGKVGLWTKADSVTSFDDLEATEL
ncbi:MAG: hypothetical protein KIT84_11515 [Labilithrix sp.]|nr:hypothetical protein [Labilithrix sp.]MCW5811638.1 hypothetical protein [Labilithrix sp.]